MDLQICLLDLTLKDEHGLDAIQAIKTSSDALRQANEQNYTLLQKPIVREVLKGAIDAALAAHPRPAMEAEGTALQMSVR